MKRVITTSWDDGHPLDLRIADLLTKYGLPGTFYVPFENSRRVMAPSEVRELSQTFEIGAHTVHHVDLTSVSSAVAEQEIAESKERLEGLIGRSCVAFCFPKGRFRARHVPMVRRAGFQCARTVELLSTGFPQCCCGLYVMPTTIQVNSHTSLSYFKNCTKRLRFGNFGRFISRVRTDDWVTAAQTLLRIVVERGGVFHLWGHSWEIEEDHQWGNLEIFFSELQQLRNVATYVPNSDVCTCF